MLAAAFGSLMPASAIETWLPASLRISGSLTPSLSTRERMIEIAWSICSSVGGFLGSFGTALSTTSRPPLRSRPSTGDFAHATTPVRASRTSMASRIR